MNMLKKLYTLLMAKEVPPIIRTTDDILKELNGPTLKGDWVKMDGYLGMSSPEILGSTLNFLAPKGGILSVAFVNTKTAQIKFFIAKGLDIPEREQLWQ